MRLEVLPSSRKRRVLSRHVVNYTAFREDFRTQEDESELHLLEKFHAARVLSQNRDVDTFVEPVLYDPEKHSHRLTSDLVGVEGSTLTAVFCETKPPDESLLKDLGVIDEAENSKAVVVYPSKANSNQIGSYFPEAVDSGKFVIEHLNWRDRGLERAFREALELMDLLCNETRVKMLLPLLEHPQGKKNFRQGINPKLIYENVPLLRAHKLIDELSDDLYDLTPIGKTILGEYLAFVEKVRDLLERADKE
ncbi:MAG: hypothetical protein ABSC50_01570 [Candidatus Bathyarchaeia archaeon]